MAGAGLARKEDGMDFLQRLDPELAAVLETLPAEGLFNWQDLPATRAGLDQMFATMSADVPDSPHVLKQDRAAPGPDGAPDVPVRVYRPTHATGQLPGLFWIHGGGMVLGSLAMDDHNIQHIVDEVGCVAVSVEYRLAPEHPFPAPVEDCYAALKWTHAQASELGIDPRRIAVGGASAGGGLAAGLVLLARDRGEVPVAFQWLIYPMLDDRNITPASHAITDVRVWNREANLFGWAAYLGREPGSEGVSPYAAPARATDLSNLPPAYLPVGSQDLFLDESADYAVRLARAGVPVEFHVYPGAFHGSELFAPAAAVSQRMIADRDQALKRALHPEVVHPAAALAV
jgi:acetyl esterase/lipase